MIQVKFFILDSIPEVTQDKINQFFSENSNVELISGQTALVELEGEQWQGREALKGLVTIFYRTDESNKPDESQIIK